MIDPPNISELFSRSLFTIGSSPVTLAGLVIALVITIFSYMAARLVVRLIARLRGCAAACPMAVWRSISWKNLRATEFSCWA